MNGILAFRILLELGAPTQKARQALQAHAQ